MKNTFLSLHHRGGSVACTGGSGRCGAAVFTDRNGEDVQKLLPAFHTLEDHLKQ